MKKLLYLKNELNSASDPIDLVITKLQITFKISQKSDTINAIYKKEIEKFRKC